MNETNSVVTALLSELIAHHVAFGTIEEILMALAEIPAEEPFSFDLGMSLDIAAGVTQSLMLMERNRAVAQNNVPKILDASGQEA